MKEDLSFILGTKCAPEEKFLSAIKKAGIEAVELYLSQDILKGVDRIIDLCRQYPFRYVLHAPVNNYDLYPLSKLAGAIEAELVVFHNIYWQDEWKEIMEAFKDIKAKICIENISSVNETIKLRRRFGLGLCLDLEHLQLECAGLFKAESLRVIKDASHIHLSGYHYGSELWHTHMHHSSQNSMKLLNLLRDAGYSGIVISEAKESLQTYEEFKRLNDFFNMWVRKHISDK
jgi:sugar phosphate isomerase/epimerase